MRAHSDNSNNTIHVIAVTLPESHPRLLTEQFRVHTHLLCLNQSLCVYTLDFYKGTTAVS